MLTPLLIKTVKRLIKFWMYQLQTLTEVSKWETEQRS